MKTITNSIAIPRDDARSGFFCIPIEIGTDVEIRRYEDLVIVTEIYESEAAFLKTMERRHRGL